MMVVAVVVVTVVENLHRRAALFSFIRRNIEERPSAALFPQEIKIPT